MHARGLVQTFDAVDPARSARFWAAVLDRPVVDEPLGLLLPGTETQVGLRFVAGRAADTGPGRVHLHLTSKDADDQQRIVGAARRLGARHLDVGQLPEEGHVVLADPAGDAFCVIEPGNTFLAGCGTLGELACDGTRDVGLFWAHALSWPLVWDEDEETAVQAPAGGTKVAWGGPPLEPKRGRNRQRFELVCPDGDVPTEADRLVALGATRVLGSERDVVELADPDGNEFFLTTR